VDDLNAMEAAVVDLILGGLEQVVVAERVVAGPRLRASYEQDPGLPPSDGGREARVLLEPAAALLVPVGDLGPESVLLRSGRVRGDRLLGGERGGIEAGGGAELTGLVGVRVGVGADLAEDAVDVLDSLGAADGVVVGGLGGEGEVEADGAAEDEDGDEAAEHGDLEVVEGAVDLARAALEQRRPSRARRRHRQRSSSPRFAVVVPHPPPAGIPLGFMRRGSGSRGHSHGAGQVRHARIRTGSEAATAAEGGGGGMGKEREGGEERWGGLSGHGSGNVE
jgi:hypothetical protein